LGKWLIYLLKIFVASATFLQYKHDRMKAVKDEFNLKGEIKCQK